jgi:hypothetical protein
MSCCALAAEKMPAAKVLVDAAAPSLRSLCGIAGAIDVMDLIPPSLAALGFHTQTDASSRERGRKSSPLGVSWERAFFPSPSGVEAMAAVDFPADALTPQELEAEAKRQQEQLQAHCDALASQLRALITAKKKQRQPKPKHG